jgi:CO/xanthine dehydrogenase Mo-binding subunit
LSAKLPGSLETNRHLSQWLRFDADGLVEARSGKVELGQGILTSLAQIVAEELDVSLARVRMLPASTLHSPDEGVTSGSLSMQQSGTALRHAAAEARAILLALAAGRLEAPAGSLTVEDGDIVAPDGARTNYWVVAKGEVLDREASGNAKPKQPDAYTLVGASVERRELVDKVFGTPHFIHDLELPGMLHGRVLRPASPGATLTGFDEDAARAQPGVVAIVRDGNFLGVVAQSAVAAERALTLLAARWNAGDPLPDEQALTGWLKSQPVESSVVAERGDVGGGPIARTVRALYTKPFVAHASMAPSCAIACWREGMLHVHSHSQGIYNLRADLALALGVQPADISVEHVAGAGCYGHNAADDVPLDAALLARAVPGRPVRVQWSRADELAWAPFGPAMAVELEADLDAQGGILAWRHEIWSNGHGSRPGRAKVPALLAARHLEKAFPPLVSVNAALSAGGGAERNADPPYALGAIRVRSNRVLAMPIRTSAVRSLGAHANVFAIESFLDEIAGLRGEDPLAIRLRLLADSRGRAVLEAAARRARWGERQRVEGVGHGIGYARYKGTGAWCAVVAEIEAGREIRVRRLTIAVDVGLAVNPDGVANQVEGAAIQAASITLKEAVRFDRERVTSASWEDYPILGFSDVPAVDVIVLQRPTEPCVGAGEASMGPTAAAIGNAVHDALGVRVRDMPITPERILRAAQ